MIPSTLQSAWVYNDGKVDWFPSMNFRTYCPLDLTHFPFDEHVCTIRTMSWTYRKDEVNSAFFVYDKIFVNVGRGRSTDTVIVVATAHVATFIQATCTAVYLGLCEEGAPKAP